MLRSGLKRIAYQEREHRSEHNQENQIRQQTKLKSEIASPVHFELRRLTLQCIKPQKSGRDEDNLLQRIVFEDQHRAPGLRLPVAKCRRKQILSGRASATLCLRKQNNRLEECGCQNSKRKTNSNSRRRLLRESRSERRQSRRGDGEARL
jgi:hypothetical protein